MIDWNDPKAMVSKHFCVREALWLPTWKRLASPTAPGDALGLDAQGALIFLFQKMDIIRDFIGLPILVHVAFRPPVYNQEIGGAPNSAHIARADLIAAVDWSVSVMDDLTPGESCETIRHALIPNLEGWGVRMEKNGNTAPWIHIDTMPVPAGGNRYFLP
jgi:hypothetical protein